MGSSGGAWPDDPSIAIQVLFRAAGHRRRSDRHARRLFARRCRRLCGRKPEARAAQCLEEGLFQEIGHAGEGHHRPDHPRPRRTHASRHDDAVAGRAQAGVRGARRIRGLRCGRASSAIRKSKRSTTSITPAIRPASSTAPPPCCSAPRKRAMRSGLKPRARIRAFASIGSEPCIMLTGPADVTREGAEARRHDDGRHRSLRTQRSLRLGRAALHARDEHSARQDQRERRRHRAWAIRWAPPAP